MAVTIKDVAKATGLSLSTISKYINGGTVRTKNKLRIEEAIRTLGFSPNIMARGLRSSKTYSIGLVLPYLKDTYSAINAAKIERYLHRAGYAVVLCCHRDDTALANEAIRFLADRHVDGILFNGIPDSHLDFGPSLREHIPVVAFEHPVFPEQIDCVMVDNSFGAYQAVEYLFRQGHRHIATITGDLCNNTAIERLRGYKRVFEDYGIPLDESLIYEGSYDVGSGYRGILHFQKLEQKPDAVFIANYHMGIGAIMGIQQCNIEIPEELSVITFDDMRFSQIVNPTLTSVRQPIDEMVEQSCRILIKRINGEGQQQPYLLRLKPQLIIRNSVRRA